MTMQEEPGNNQTAIARRPPAEVLAEEASLERTKTQLKLIQQFYRDIMEEDVDYGIIPGTPRPSLWLPGAELLRLGLRLRHEFTLCSKEENWDIPRFVYCYRCDIYGPNDTKLGDAEGICSSEEAKFKWRWFTEEKLPRAVDKTRLETRLTDKNVMEYRCLNPDLSELAHIIADRAQKRSFVKGIRLCTAASRIFADQDYETDNGDTKPSKRKHWCEKHQVAFFKRGKMTRYAHPIQGGGWCAEEAAESPPTAPNPPPAAKQSETQLKRDPATVKTLGDLFKACLDDFNMQPPQVLAELNVKSKEEIVDPAACYRIIAAARG